MVSSRDTILQWKWGLESTILEREDGVEVCSKEVDLQVVEGPGP
jgi:hypothetical protein